LTPKIDEMDSKRKRVLYEQYLQIFVGWLHVLSRLSGLLEEDECVENVAGVPPLSLKGEIRLKNLAHVDYAHSLGGR
jgi:hypothetical protein